MTGSALVAYGNKSPLHERALRLNDIVPGRHIIQFNLKYGAETEYLVLAPPMMTHFRLRDGEEWMDIKIPMVSLDNGYISQWYATDMGLSPCDHFDGWNPVNFVIDASDRDSLLEFKIDLFDLDVHDMPSVHEFDNRPWYPW